MRKEVVITVIEDGQMPAGGVQVVCFVQNNILGNIKGATYNYYIFLLYILKTLSCLLNAFYKQHGQKCQKYLMSFIVATNP